jgi:hypothetical protein
MPILGLSIFVGKWRAFLQSFGGVMLGLRNCNAMFGKTVRCRCCPATVSDVVVVATGHCRKVGRLEVLKSLSQETGRVADVNVPLPRGRRPL